MSAQATQSNSPWNLARLSRENVLPASGPYSYYYDDVAGDGTCAYIIDSGIDVTHPEFGGRAQWAINLVAGGNQDSGYHGTFVAGIVGSNTYGVAKKAKLFAVKVLNESGQTTV